MIKPFLIDLQSIISLSLLMIIVAIIILEVNRGDHLFWDENYFL